MLIFVSSNIIKSLKNYVLKVLTTFIHFTKRTEVLLAIDDCLPMLMHECHGINDSVQIFAIVLYQPYAITNTFDWNPAIYSRNHRLT